MGGCLLSFDLKRRRKDLEQFLIGIRVIAREMSYEAPSLELCFDRASKATRNVVSDVFSEISVNISKGESGESSVSKVLKAYRDDLALTERDMEQLFRLGSGLGEHDLEHALKDLSHVEASLEEIIKDADYNEKKWGRLFSHGGWLTGFCVALFFI